MEHFEIWPTLLDIVILLGGSLLLGGLFSRFGQSPLVGYLLAGMILGGGGFNLIHSEHNVEAISELGATLLLFSLGLEFSVDRLRSLGGRSLLGGVSQVVLTLAAGALVGLIFGLKPVEAIVVGAMVSLSSTAVVLRVLMERAEIDSAHGRNSLAVLLIQDMAVVPLAILFAILSGGGTPGEILANIGRILLLAAGLVLGLYVLLEKVAVAALGTLTLERNRELTLILAVLTGLGSAWAAQEIKISPALGAFVAGMFLGSSAFATQVRADVASLRTLLLTLFFSAAGMKANPAWIAQHWPLVTGITALLIVGKTIIVWLVFVWLKQLHQIALASGISLAQIGEFAFVLGSLAVSSGILSEETNTVMVSVTILTLFISPYLVPRAPALGYFLATKVFRRKETFAKLHKASSEGPDVVVFGYGPAGQLAARPFSNTAFRLLVIDLNQEGVRRARQCGFEGEIGDATQPEVLEHFSLGSVKLFIITIPNFTEALKILSGIRLLAPTAQVVVRSRYQTHSHQFATAGAHTVFGDEEEIGQRLGTFAHGWICEAMPEKQGAAEGS